MNDIWEKFREDGFEISTDKSRLDIKWIADFLQYQSYWANMVDRAVIEKSIRNSIAFGLYDSIGNPAGCALVISDRARYAYLSDIFIGTSYRGQGLGVWLLKTVMTYPEFEHVNSWALRTQDAHTLYEKVGFRRIGDSLGRAMELTRP